MRRRAFLKMAAAVTLAGVTGEFALNPHAHALEDADPALDKGVRDRLMKSRLFDQAFGDDIVLDSLGLSLLKSSLDRLTRLQALVGYANFSLLDLDTARAYAKNYPVVGAFPSRELEFLDDIFHAQAEKYGFMGKKPIEKITRRISKKNVKKISHTGNYLYRGEPVALYRSIREKVGENVILTSGVRGVMKQFFLFLNKASESQGNLSLASRSLAPPGYSFHGIGDFDVGQKGYGVDNFTAKFTETQVYQKLTSLGYIRFRYERENDLGVRFEPWHIEVV